jgi:hypothetical protein
LSQIRQSLQRLAIEKGEILAGLQAEKWQVRNLDRSDQFVATHRGNSGRGQVGNRFSAQLVDNDRCTPVVQSSRPIHRGFFAGKYGWIHSTASR